jgi:hypothetical protein
LFIVDLREAAQGTSRRVSGHQTCQAWVKQLTQSDVGRAPQRFLVAVVGGGFGRGGGPGGGPGGFGMLAIDICSSEDGSKRVF